MQSVNRLSARHQVYLLVLIATLPLVYWLAGTLDRYAVPEEQDLIFSPSSGSFTKGQLIEIHASQPGAPVVFTTDGTTPSDVIGTLYSHPLRLDGAAPGVTVLRAREYLGGEPGPIQNASYAVGVAHTLPILSLIVDPADLWDAQRGILVNDWQRGQAWERPAHLTFIDEHGETQFEVLAGLRVHGSEPSDAPKQSFGLYFRQDYGASRLVDPLFPGRQRDDASFKRLLLQAGAPSSPWTLIEQELLAQVATEMNGHAAQGRFALLFLNGAPWGIYRLSERIDRFYLEDILGYNTADLLLNGEVVEGDDRAWNTLLNWLETQDLRDPAAYAELETKTALDSLTDAILLHIYFGSLADDVMAARPTTQEGRWLWLFGEQHRAEGRPAELTDPTLPTTGASDDLDLLAAKLLQNPDYRARFVRRGADLLNTVLSPAAMVQRVDGISGLLQPDIDYELARWWRLPSDPAGKPSPHGDDEAAHVMWEYNIQMLREFTAQRAAAVRSQLLERFDLQGTAPLTLSLSTDQGGYLILDEQALTNFPWSGTFFLDSELELIAVPEPGYRFAGWENVPADPSSARITLPVDGPRDIVAHFDPLPPDDPGLRPNDVIINEYWINDDGTRYSSAGGKAIEGDWLELLVTRPSTIDLRGWRVTDNNTKAATDEGSIIFPALPPLAAVPQGTAILLIATQNTANDAQFPRDDLDPSDGQMILYAGNGHLDVTTDPGFGIGTDNDNLALLAPGPSPSFADDVGVDFVAEGDAVTPLSFGVLPDGVTFHTPFQGLGNDDGAVFIGKSKNDDGAIDWIVDPASLQSGDDLRPGATNILTPGGPNYSQNGLSVPGGLLWLSLIGLGILAIVGLRHGSRNRTRH